MTDQQPQGTYVAANSRRNIVLCSDGTGNAGGKKNGTNVWRLYLAIKPAYLLNGDKVKQIAFHDDGVGSQDFKLLKALGGAMGLGLANNIRQLYISLVRAYAPGDQIFLFGFSRGAYTVRSLANLIHHYGVLDRNAFATPQDLEHAVESLFSAYQAQEEESRPSFPVPVSDGRIPTGIFRRAGDGGEVIAYRAMITFLGVWDTVGAIGVPFDELRTLLEKFLPVVHHETDLRDSIEYAYHALSIDDHRRTFHPVMFNEKKQGTQTHVEQVWFSGVHSNVGGSYPKDQMALVALNWMMSKAEALNAISGDTRRPLAFNAGLRSQYEEGANVHGKLYNSRAGFAAYYRLKSRDIGNLCKNHCAAEIPHIHESVFERIRHRTDGYAPANIPERYELVVPAPRPIPEREAGRVKMTERASDFARMRGRLYYAFLALSILTVFVVLWLGAAPKPAFGTHWGVLEPFANAVGALVPDFLGDWVQTLFVDHPRWLLLFGGIYGLLLWARMNLKTLTNNFAGIGWRYSFLRNRPEETERLGRMIEDLPKRSRLWMETELSGRWRWLFGVSLALLVTGGALVWTGPERDLAAACAAPDISSARAADGAWRIARFDTRHPCFRTGIELNRGDRIRAQIAVTAPWLDKTIPAGPEGFLDKEDGEHWLMRLWKPALRAPKVPYFVLLGQMVTDASGTAKLIGDPFPIGEGGDLAPVNERGELVLFVNDVDCRWCPPGRFTFYGNNQGTAAITIQRVGG